MAAEQRTLAEAAGGKERFDVGTMIASLHHQNLEAALGQARGLLAPRGRLLVVGL